MPVSICATPHTCVECGAIFFPKRTDRIYCCSSKCGRVMSGRQAAERSAQERGDRPWPSTPVRWFACPVCHEPKWVRQSSPRKTCAGRCYARQNYMDLHPHLMAERPCKHCGVSIDPKAVGARLFCSKRCSKVHARIGRPSTTHRARARRAGVAYESVNPTDIFERDDWRCQLCGIKTPKRLRGSHDPRAPEMDHIVPLALKGAHTRNNLHCACRACNNAKGAQWQGQTLLFG